MEYLKVVILREWAIVKLNIEHVMNIGDIVDTLIGVFAGGIISTITSNFLNRKNIKKRFMFDLLSEIKILLRDWENELLECGVEFCECENVKQFRGYVLSNSLRILIQKIELNKYILAEFDDEFKKIRSKDLAIQSKNIKNKEEILRLSKKYNTENVNELLEYEEVSSILDSYADDILNLNNEISSLISKIDNYIYKKIL